MVYTASLHRRRLSLAEDLICSLMLSQAPFRLFLSFKLSIAANQTEILNRYCFLTSTPLASWYCILPRQTSVLLFTYCQFSPTFCNQDTVIKITVSPLKARISRIFKCHLLAVCNQSGWVFLSAEVFVFLGMFLYHCYNFVNVSLFRRIQKALFPGHE